MNAKTAKLINKAALIDNVNRHSAKRVWNETPAPLRFALRRKLQAGIESHRLAMAS